MNNDLNDILRKEDLQKSPFQVPDNYFDTLQANLLANAGIKEKPAEKIEQKQPTRFARIISMRTVKWAAACACVAIVTASAYFFTTEKEDAIVASHSLMEQEYYSDDAFEAAADYTMLDSHDMYMMLAEE